jgi:hypothetical protein
MVWRAAKPQIFRNGNLEALIGLETSSSSQIPDSNKQTTPQIITSGSWRERDVW